MKGSRKQAACFTIIRQKMEKEMNKTAKCLNVKSELALFVVQQCSGNCILSTPASKYQLMQHQEEIQELFKKQVENLIYRIAAWLSGMHSSFGDFDGPGFEPCLLPSQRKFGLECRLSELTRKQSQKPLCSTVDDINLV